MSSQAEVMDRIKAIPNSACFLAQFLSVNAATSALKQLSFAEVDSRGLALPEAIHCEMWKQQAGCVEVILGGALSGEQRVEVYNSFERNGTVKAVALPPGAASLGNHQSRTPAHKPRWKMW